MTDPNPDDGILAEQKGYSARMCVSCEEVPAETGLDLCFPCAMGVLIAFHCEDKRDKMFLSLGLLKQFRILTNLGALEFEDLINLHEGLESIAGSLDITMDELLEKEF